MALAYLVLVNWLGSVRLPAILRDTYLKMAPEAQAPSILRFGVFEVDLRSRELRKQGVRIKLQEQPFHVLTVLLQRPGEVVTREELRSQNWPADTFVDFDNSLNTAINKLREALGDFANSTVDAVFDGTLREGLSVQLEQSPFLSLVSEEGIHQTLRMMERPANTQLTPEITREVCQRTSSAAALEGSIALIGTRYTLILKAVNCVNGDLLASTEAQANDKSHVLDALGKAASEIRRKLGESFSTTQKFNTPLQQATTPSLEALQAYNFSGNTDDDAAQLAFYQRAIQLDPN